jgi:MFS family permease
MRHFIARYRDFFRQPGVAMLTAVALVSRMPIGMVGLALLMFSREALGSYALAGSISGVYFVAMAVGAPVQGRLIDRSGPWIVLFVTGIVHPLSLLALYAAARSGAGFASLALAAAFAGLFSMPITVLTRTVWRHRFEREADRRRAFAIDSVMIEINFTLGPAIVAAVLATAGTTFAYLLSVATTVAAFLFFIASPAPRYFRAGTHAGRHMLGPLAEPRLLLVFVSTFGLAVGFGLLEVGYPGYATALAIPALGGILLSICSAGSAIGGAVFGGISFKAPIERQFVIATGLMVVPLLLHYCIDAQAAFIVIAFFAGAAIAPSITCQSVLVSRFAPSHYATEAFTWSSTFIVSGLGAGMAFGGWLIETHGAKSPFLAGAAVMVAVCLSALLLDKK